MSSSKKNYKEKIIRRKEEKTEEPELPKYRDRAKERREDQNPDYEPGSLGSFHSVAPPGTVDLRAADAHKISIENSKYLGGDVEHTHLVKGLDFALLHKVRSEIDKKPDAENVADGKSSDSKEDQPLSFRTATAKLVYQWIVKPQTIIKPNEMFLPGRMAYIFNMEGGFSTDIPTTLHRSKDDCPVSEEMVTVSVDGSVLDRIAKIMSYLRLGSSGKVLKRKKKERDIKEKLPSVANGYEEEEKSSNNRGRRQMLPPPPPLPRKNNFVDHREMPQPAVGRSEEEDIFVGEGINYDIPVSEDMDESPNTHKDGVPNFSGPAFGPVPPSDQPPQEWQQMQEYDGLETQAGMSGGYPEWSEYQYAEQLAYSQQYAQQSYDVQSDSNITPLDPRLMSQEEKDRGLGSVFLRDDHRLQQLREKDCREKDPNFISESYSECYPGYQDYNREVMSDDDGDFSKMDMGGRAKGRLHRWDFETEEEWAKYNEQKEAMPKAAFQFGVKMQDGRKTRKQNKDQKITNELHKINRILARNKGGDHDLPLDHYDYDVDDDLHAPKKTRI